MLSFERAISEEVSLLLGRAKTNTNTMIDTQIQTVRHIDMHTDRETNSYSIREESESVQL